MYSKLTSYISKLESGFNSIPSSRKNELEKVVDYIGTKLANDNPIKLKFICTHNSRRSHFAQVWAAIASHYYDITEILTFSGGTEATAFHPNAVAALERAGFSIENPGGKNPRYRVWVDKASEPMVCFSKKFDDPSNPKSEFAAIMTCSDADKNCPFVPGAEFRIPITYRDPKESDGTDRECETYDECCRQIATEIFFMFHSLKN